MPVSCGNLAAVVQKLTGGGAGSIADLVYPVGAIYLSASATSPQTLFGGTWTRIQDRFLLCAGSKYKAGGTGGEATHTLSVDEMPSHSHTMTFSRSESTSGSQTPITRTAWSGTIEYETDAAGGGSAHNNMPPYLAVYAWKRTA